MSAAADNRTFVLTLSCTDRRGIVAEVARFLLAHGCNIVDSAQFGDPITGQFFLRIQFDSQEGAQLTDLQHDFGAVARTFAMTHTIYDAFRKTRTLILVSRFGHCLVDLLYRNRIGALPIEIPLIVSNHHDFEGVCAKLPGQIINIHHSFLPSFKGGRPYQQAHERGVKLIGATAHYVTSSLDEGPIIEQAVERVVHAMTPEDFASVGRDIESVVLARAVKWHTEHRILINGKRTIVFA